MSALWEAMIAYLRRLLCVAIGVVSPSVLATVRRASPLPRSWLARREWALALRELGDRLSLAELALLEAERTGRYLEAVAEMVDKATP